MDRVTQVHQILSGTRGLQGLSRDALGPLAAQLRLTRYPRGHVFFRDQHAEERAPLAIITLGQLLWHPRARVDHPGAPTLGPGALFGLASVAAWARARGPRVLADLYHPGAVAEAQESLWVLELPLDRYEAAFPAPESCPVLRRLLGLHGASAYWGRVSSALHHTPEFVRSSPRNVARLAQAGVLEVWEPGEVHTCGGDAEMAMFYVVSGALMVREEDGHTGTVIAGDLTGNSGVFAAHRPGRVLTAVGDRPTTVVRVRDRELTLTLNTTPGMLRVLGPPSLGPVPDSLPSAARPLVSTGEVTLVLADPGVPRDPLPMRALVRLLAARTRSHLGDHVWVIRLVPEDHPVEPRPGVLHPPTAHGMRDRMLEFQ